MKKTYEAFPVNRLPEELRRGLRSGDVVQISIETGEQQTDEEAEHADVPASIAEQERLIKSIFAQRKFW